MQYFIKTLPFSLAFMTLLAEFLNGRICELFTLLRKIICQINFVMIRKKWQLPR